MRSALPTSRDGCKWLPSDSHMPVTSLWISFLLLPLALDVIWHHLSTLSLVVQIVSVFCTHFRKWHGLLHSLTAQFWPLLLQELEYSNTGRAGAKSALLLYLLQCFFFFNCSVLSPCYHSLQGACFKYSDITLWQLYGFCWFVLSYVRDVSKLCYCETANNKVEIF